jgi:O-antigen ligase
VTAIPRLPKTIYFLAVASLIPIQKISLPFNSILFDYVNFAFMGPFLLYLVYRRKLQFRLLVPWCVILAASLVSMINSAGVGENIQALVQELYLFMFFITVYNLIEDEDDTTMLAVPWFALAAVYGCLVARELIGEFGVRAGGTFQTDNAAGAYLGISFFLMFHPFLAKRTMWKLAIVPLILAGIFATKSLSAVLGVVVGLVAMLSLYSVRAGAALRAKLLFAALTLITVVIAFFPAIQSVPNFLNRLPRSSEGRRILWKTGLETFLDNPLGIGIGPARFKQEVLVIGGTFEGGRRKELHSDYLSFLVERGVLGFMGLMLLLGSIGAMLWRSLQATRAGPQFLWVLGLCGMFSYMLVDALSHEVLHYRHVWVVVALIAAQERLTASTRR